MWASVSEYLNKSRLLLRIGDKGYRYGIHPIETAAGLTAASLTFGFDPGDVRRYGAKWDGATNDTAALAVAVSTGLPILLPAGTGIGSMSFRRNGAVVVGPGVALCTLRHPAGALAPGGTVELGDTVSGNAAVAYTDAYIVGFTIDGNRAAAAAPVDDLHGHGLALTKYQHAVIDVDVINAPNAGVGIFINSNFVRARARVVGCGNATYTGPGFDVNSSKHLALDVLSDSCYQGARILGNCNNINGRVDVYNATQQGVLLQNANGNISNTVNLDITIDTTGTHALLVQNDFLTSNIRASIINSGGVGCYIVAGSPSAADDITGFVLDVITRNSQQQGMLCYGDSCNIRHVSYLDGRSGAAGSYYALDVNGNNCTIESIVHGDAQVRSAAVRAGATGNRFVSLFEEACLSGFSDAGTSTQTPVTVVEIVNSWDPPSVAAGAQATTVVAVTGAAFGDLVQVGWGSDLQGCLAWGYVSSAGNVTVVLHNFTAGAIDFGATNVTIRLVKQ